MYIYSPLLLSCIWILHRRPKPFEFKAKLNQSSKQELIPFLGGRSVIISPCDGAIGKYFDTSTPMAYLAIVALSPRRLSLFLHKNPTRTDKFGTLSAGSIDRHRPLIFLLVQSDCQVSHCRRRFSSGVLSPASMMNLPTYHSYIYRACGNSS